MVELDSFLATPRWEILRAILDNPSSPMEISEKLGTTISFISQQLKLLEAAGLVIKKRTGAVDKGKPRTIFSIPKESVYLIPLANDISNKKLIPLTREHKIILKIWTEVEQNIQPILEKFFWKIEPFLDVIDGIFIHSKNFSLKIYILSKDKSLIQKINNIQKNVEERIDFQVISSKNLISKLDSKGLVSLYGTQPRVEEKIDLKGGLEENE